jgi:peptide/nickel transport system substrate-binding protein
VIAVLGLAGTACGGGGTTSDSSAPTGDGHGTLHVGVTFSLDSWETLDKPNTTYLEGLFEGLVALDADGIKVSPRLATKWTQTPTELSFTLRSGVLFHDGTPFDSDAVKVNLERVRDTPSGLQPLMEPVSEIVTPDPTHVVLKLKHQAPTLVQQLARRGGLMLSAKSIREGTYKTRPAGTGPYKYNESKSIKGARVVYDLFPGYYDLGSVGPHSLVLQFIGDDDSMVNALTTGQVDVAAIAAASQKRVEGNGFKTLWYPALRYHFLFFDLAKTLADANVRRAVCYALDPKAIIAAQYENLGETYTQRFSEGQAGYNPDVKGYPHDVAKAKELLAQAGNPNIAITFPVFTSQANLGELARSKLGEAGINVTVERMSTAQFFSTYDSGKYPAAYNTSTNEDPGPLDYYQYHLAPDAPDNKFKVPHPQLDKLAEQGMKETDPAKQNEIWKQMTKVIHDEALDCGYLSLTIVWAWNAKKVSNIVPTRFQPSMFRYAEAKANG